MGSRKARCKCLSDQRPIFFVIAGIVSNSEQTYGYYDAAPYECAPYGYYGPEWFTGGVFLGAGPWFHGPDNFRGHVNNRFHPEHGYRGPKPQRGEKAEPSNRLDKVAHFKGNEVRDGRGHAGGGKH